MADKETVERWTVPQASVWIRTRDLEIVRGLTPRTARSLFLACSAWPGVHAASDCLMAALRTGRVAASGRRMRLPDLIPGARREKSPQEFWQAGADLSDDTARGVVARESGGAGRWVDLDVEANACIGHWQPPSAILADGALSLGQFAAQLRPEPIDRLRWLLTHPAVIVTGLNDRAERVTVDGPALAFGNADIEADTVTTHDGRLSWSAVMVELAPAAERHPAPRKIYGKGLSQTERCKADLLLVFPPDGEATGTYREIGERIEKETEHRYSKDVLRVALGTKNP
jgi:hypothetical protein